MILLATSPCTVLTIAPSAASPKLSLRLPPLMAVLISAALPALARLTVRLLIHCLSLTLFSAEAPILSATPAVAAATTRFFTVLLLPSSFRVLPTSPLLLMNDTEAWLAKEANAASVAAAAAPFNPNTAPVPAPEVTTVTASAIIAAPASVKPSCL
ncbi:Uncharacterised protein [Neisseria meningitidis]|nr:Uncharacterised protein [Neisseria meningitidis]CWP24600.1 Uncharacterised protein [Neisseria meningitidis]CWQ17064.1 Uncharacterised protein [Neisseria meningitidis]CWU27201.1 Uncharacterised protein [Neisseria meningitidis]